MINPALLAASTAPTAPPALADPDLLPTRVDGGVRFRFVSAAGVDQVAVAGTFNAWRADRHPMVRTGPSRWEAVVPMAMGRHLYKFVVDGRDWIRDPANPKRLAQHHVPGVALTAAPASTGRGRRRGGAS